MISNSELDMKATANLDEIEHGSGRGEKTPVDPSGRAEDIPTGHIHSLDVRLTQPFAQVEQ
jgi:hypothetical protein